MLLRQPTEKLTFDAINSNVYLFKDREGVQRIGNEFKEEKEKGITSRATLALALARVINPGCLFQ